MFLSCWRWCDRSIQVFSRFRYALQLTIVIRFNVVVNGTPILTSIPHHFAVTALGEGWGGINMVRPKKWCLQTVHALAFAFNSHTKAVVSSASSRFCAVILLLASSIALYVLMVVARWASTTASVTWNSKQSHVMHQQVGHLKQQRVTRHAQASRSPETAHSHTSCTTEPSHLKQQSAAHHAPLRQSSETAIRCIFCTS